MDLVDIDQVLDNFELSEQAEEQQKAAALLESANSANGLTNKATATPVTQANLSNSSPTPTSSTVTTKNFIGVSQVFNSLDDYTKNVEQLHTAATQKYDEECRAVNQEKPPSNNVKPVNNYDGLEDEEASSEIHKFKEHQRKRLDSKEQDHDSNDDDDVSEQSLSDSLTTSSSSSFSSGPSLGGMGSTVEEHTVPTTPADIEADQIESSPLLNESSSDQQEIEENSRNAEVEVEKEIEQREEPLETLDDIAEGLSSISLSTANSQSVVQCDATASSVLANKLDSLHTETQSTSLLSQQPENLETNRDFESSSIVPVSETCPLDTEDEPDQCPEEQNHLNEASKNLLQAANEILALTKQPVFEEPKPPQQPITFCSTMDDISDAELDSMLQEMEIDEDQAKANEAQAEEVSAPSEPEVPEPLKTDAVTTSVEVFSAKSPDHNNADSFSQASTVEFSEVKGQTNNASLPEPEADLAVQSPSSVMSSYSSTEESSLEGELAANLAEDDGLRPQRPTSLDIPNVNPALYTNAGQTPPDMCGVVQQHEDSDDPRAEESATSSEATAPGEIAEASGYSDPHANLGKLPPIWVPDNMASGCMQCGTKFTVLKRRHHCRACGKVLCSACCSQKFKLDFLQEPESRVCIHCFLILMQRQHTSTGSNGEQLACAAQQENLMTAATQPIRSPNPNNPMEYCSTIPPHCQVSAVATPPPSVIVPVGVLKKDGSYSSNSSNCSAKQGRKRKSVMFSDGIAPGSELASSLEQQWGEAKQPRRGHQQQQHGDKQGSCPTHNKPGTPLKNESRNDLTTMGLVAQLFRGSIPPMAAAAAVSTASGGSGSSSASAAASVPSKSKQEQRSAAQAAKRVPPAGCDENGCFIPQADGMLPPLYISKGASISDYDYKEVANNFELVTRLQSETLKFAIKSNFLVHVKILNLKCCMNRTVINFTTSGMHHVGNDEIIILLEYEPPAKKELMLEPPLPRDIFLHLYEIYREAELGRPIAELSYTSPRQANFLGSREYGGFMYIRISFQCLQDIIVPENPFLVGILIHRHEVPWAKVFPLRLMLRLGAQYRYYPCPHISIRNRESVYAEIAQTIINFLADFRHYSYTLPTIRGMFIHMEDRQTTVMIPRNRLDDVIKAINNASDHILALGGNFSKSADGHLVCMQNTNDDKTEMYAYSTQAINIQGQPRKVTGASFIVLNEALKSSSGLSGKCSIVEDGLMVQIMPTKMEEVRNALRNQENINIVCGPIDADEQQTEIVSIKWVDNDRDFNLGVISPIDGKSMEGISSMRVHASFNYSNTNYAIRLTDIFIIKFDDWYNSAQESLNAASLDITRLAEQIARSASMALVPFLDLLAASGNIKMALRATLHQENVCYEAGAQGAKLPPLYMNALDNHLIPTLHNESTGIEEAIVLELIFYILNV